MELCSKSTAKHILCRYNNKPYIERLAARLGPYVSRLEEIGRPIISCGSGTGVIEAAFQLLGYCGEIICIDPEPQSWDTESTIIAPHYATVEQLLADRPTLRGNCSLMLIWTFPDLNYDCQAIASLIPKAFLALYSASAGSGSYIFHHMMQLMRLPNAYDMCSKYELTYPYNTQYQSIQLASIYQKGLVYDSDIPLSANRHIILALCTRIDQHYAAL